MSEREIEQLSDALNQGMREAILSIVDPRYFKEFAKLIGYGTWDAWTGSEDAKYLISSWSQVVKEGLKGALRESGPFDPSQPLTVDHVALYLGIEESSVLRLVSEGKLKGYQVPGGRSLFLKEDVLKYLMQNPIKNG